MADDPRDRLELLGRGEPPPPRAEFTERLADELRRTTVVTVEAPARRWGAGRWVAGVAAAAAVVAIALVVTLVDRDQPLELDAARSVRVIEADGDVIEGVPGLVLADGDRIVVGEGGRAEVGEVVLGPGDEAVVVDGRVEPVTTTTSTSTAPARTTTSTTEAPALTTTTVTDRTTTSTTVADRTTTTSTTVADRTTTTAVADRTTTTAARPATETRPSR